MSYKTRRWRRISRGRVYSSAADICTWASRLQKVFDIFSLGLCASTPARWKQWQSWSASSRTLKGNKDWSEECFCSSSGGYGHLRANLPFVCQDETIDSSPWMMSLDRSQVGSYKIAPLGRTAIWRGILNCSDDRQLSILHRIGFLGLLVWSS
jgi:hypothetical protein